MMNMARTVCAAVAVFSAFVFSGCETGKTCVCGPAAEKCAASAVKPLKVGVYNGKGATGIGAIEWFRIVNESPDMELRILSSKDVQSGALSGLDVLVMPGGNSKDEFKSLGPSGIAEMKKFLLAGGGYFGTCAGCCLLMDGPAEYRTRLMPFRTLGSEGSTCFPAITLNEKGAKALGIKKGRHVVRYHGGPLMQASTNAIENSNFECWGTFDAEVSQKGDINPAKRMYGAVAVVGGTYGKGRVFATSVHPEYFDSTLYIVAGGFRYVTGRDVKFPGRFKKPGSLNVGFWSKGLEKPGVIKTALAIDSDPGLRLVPVNVDSFEQRMLDCLDVIVVPGGTAKGIQDKKWLRKWFEDFAARGGKIIGLGKSAKAGVPGETVCGPGDCMVKTIKRLFPDA